MGKLLPSAHRAFAMLSPCWMFTKWRQAHRQRRNTLSFTTTETRHWRYYVSLLQSATQMVWPCTASHVLYQITNFPIRGTRKQGKPRKTWSECVMIDVINCVLAGTRGGTHYVRVMGRLRGIDPPFSRHWKKISILDPPFSRCLRKISILDPPFLGF